MFDIEEEQDGRIVAISVSGRLTRSDYKVIVPHLERKIEQHGKLRVLFEMRDFHGWDAGGMWEDLKFDVRHSRDAERVAMVGDRDWERWMTKLAQPFTSAEVRYFDLDERDAARQWIREGT